MGSDFSSSTIIYHLIQPYCLYSYLRSWSTVMGMGWETGSMPMRIRLAFSASFSQARASSCSACTLVRCGGVGRAWFRDKEKYQL